MDIMSQLGLSLVWCSFMCGKTHKTSSDHCQTALLSRILLLQITHGRPRQQAEKLSSPRSGYLTQPQAVILLLRYALHKNSQEQAYSDGIFCVFLFVPRGFVLTLHFWVENSQRTVPASFCHVIRVHCLGNAHLPVLPCLTPCWWCHWSLCLCEEGFQALLEEPARVQERAAQDGFLCFRSGGGAKIACRDPNHIS